MRSVAALLAVLFCTPASAVECRLALVLATDVSSSIDAGEYRLQTEGIARAFRTAELRDALLGVPGYYVSVTVVHWSGYEHQEQVVPWHFLDSSAAISRFAASAARAERRLADQPTALGKGLQYSAQLAHGRPCLRRVIDVSGDGVNNFGVGPYYFADRGLFDGLTINGLVIKGASPDPEPYYREKVIRGPGAFAMVARSYADYPRAILRKLVREVQPDYAMRAFPRDAEQR